MNDGKYFVYVWDTREWKLFPNMRLASIYANDNRQLGFIVYLGVVVDAG